MRKATVFHLRLSEDIPIQKETLSIIRSIPKGSRTAELCRMITEAQNNINQIARSVNAGIASPETAAQAVFLMRKVYELMEQAARN